MKLTGNSAVTHGINIGTACISCINPCLLQCLFPELCQSATVLNMLTVGLETFHQQSTSNITLGRLAHLIRTFLLISDIDSQCSSTPE